MRPFIFASALAALAGSAAADPAGFRAEQMFMPHHDAETRVAIWYPNGGGGAVERYGENPVFQGVDAAMGAEVAEGTYPLIMFSHGLGGTDRAQAWLGSALAERGAIVVMVNHLNSTWGSFDMSQGVQHWTRAQDISVALDAVLADPAFADHVDASRVMATGFSFGGWTALSLGGAQGNHAGTVATCEANQDVMPECGMLLSDRVRIQDQDPEAWNASYAEPRITHVASIDPGFVWGLEASDVAGLPEGVVMVALGDAQTQMRSTDFRASGLAGLMEAPKSVELSPAFHFSAMPICTAQGAAILEAEQDDPVCTDPEGTDRAGVHRGIIEAVWSAFGS